MRTSTVHSNTRLYLDGHGVQVQLQGPLQREHHLHTERRPGHVDDRQTVDRVGQLLLAQLVHAADQCGGEGLARQLQPGGVHLAQRPKRVGHVLRVIGQEGVGPGEVHQQGLAQLRLQGVPLGAHEA